MQEVAVFNDPISFWKVWGAIPHSDPKNFLQVTEEGSFRNSGPTCTKFEHNGDLSKIGTIMLFKHGVKPEWEDKENQSGGGFKYQLRSESVDEICKIWEKMVLALISGEIPHQDRLCGLRLLEKNQKRRVEFWVNYKDEKVECHKEITAALNGVLNEAIGGISNASFDFAPHG